MWKESKREDGVRLMAIERGQRRIVSREAQSKKRGQRRRECEGEEGEEDEACINHSFTSSDQHKSILLRAGRHSMRKHPH